MTGNGRVFVDGEGRLAKTIPGIGTTGPVGFVGLDSGYISIRVSFLSVRKINSVFWPLPPHLDTMSYQIPLIIPT